MTTILIATGNQGKFREIMEVLSDIPVRFVSLAELGVVNDVEETGATYEENAFLKADTFFRRTGLPTIAEDSGLEVPAFRGELGIKTRRWGAGENASDEEWLDYFLQKLEPHPDRSAQFFCTAVFVAPGIRKVFCGSTAGTLATTPQCPIPHGIPVSALFVPSGEAKVFAAMTPEEKNRISHRGKAMHALKLFLNNEYSAFQTNPI